MAEKPLNDLFLAHLKDIYYAEKKIYRTLPKMVKAAENPELKKAFTTHREEQGQIERLEQVFEMIGKRPQAKACEAINGIVAEGEETIEEFGDSPTIDAGLRGRWPGGGTLRDGPLRSARRLGDSAWHEGHCGPPQPEPAGRNERRKAFDPNCEEQSGQNCVHEGCSVANHLVTSSPYRRELVRQAAGVSSSAGDARRQAPHRQRQHFVSTATFRTPSRSQAPACFCLY